MKPEALEMETSHVDGCEVLTVTSAPDLAEFSEHLLDTASRYFLTVDRCQIIVAAQNGRWIYRPIGRRLAAQTILAVLESTEDFVIQGEASWSK